MRQTARGRSGLAPGVAGPDDNDIKRSMDGALSSASSAPGRGRDVSRETAFDARAVFT